MNESSVAIGDEVDIGLKTGEQVTLVCELMENHHVTFFTKDLLEDTHVMDEGPSTSWERHLSTMEGYLKKILRLLPESLQEVIRDGKLRLLREREVFGGNRYGRQENCEQLTRYQKQEKRVKRLSGVSFPYWLASPVAEYNDFFCNVSSNGTPYANDVNLSFGVCFGFKI